MSQALKAWGPAALWAAVLFLLSELPGLPGRPRFPLDDKVAHFFLYGVLGAALAWGRWMSGRPGRHWVPLSVGWMYGALDEWHQGFVPGRSPDPLDFLVDVVGVVVGYGLFFYFARRRKSTSPEPGGVAGGRGARGR